jgi:hypothetical protein
MYNAGLMYIKHMIMKIKMKKEGKKNKQQYDVCVYTKTKKHQDYVKNFKKTE